MVSSCWAQTVVVFNVSSADTSLTFWPSLWIVGVTAFHRYDTSSIQGLYSLWRHRRIGIVISIVNMRQASECPRFIIGIPLLIGGVFFVNRVPTNGPGMGGSHRMTPQRLDQFYGCWCTGCLHLRAIESYVIENAELTGLFLLWTLILTTFAMCGYINDTYTKIHIRCIFSRKNSVRQSEWAQRIHFVEPTLTRRCCYSMSYRVGPAKRIV